MKSILFIGYSLRDWNFRVIFKATAERSKQRTHYAVQHFKADANAQGDLESERWQKTVTFWGRKNVTIVNLDASEFMAALVKQVAGTP